MRGNRNRKHIDPGARALERVANRTKRDRTVLSACLSDMKRNKRYVLFRIPFSGKMKVTVDSGDRPREALKLKLGTVVNIPEGSTEVTYTCIVPAGGTTGQVDIEVRKSAVLTVELLSSEHVDSMAFLGELSGGEREED